VVVRENPSIARGLLMDLFWYGVGLLSLVSVILKLSYDWRE
jgi:hypothetical protein